MRASNARPRFGRVSGERFTTLALATVATIATAFVARDLPVLRHDWPPPTSNVFFAFETLCGWNPVGFGAPVGYPSSFLAVPLRAALAQLFSPYVANLIYFACVNAATSFGAARLAAVLGAPRSMRLAAALFAVFNPWVYTQTVAGHLFMLLAYAATYWLAAESLSRRPNQTRLVLLAALIAPQIQFLVLDSLWFAYLAYRFRAYRAIAAIALMGLPVAVGVALTRSSLLGIPLTLSWENDLSLRPADAAVFGGYFTQYDRELQYVAHWPMMSFAAGAVAGAVLAVTSGRGRIALLFAGIGLASFAWSTGTHGPMAPLFSWIILHVVESGLFRELYDVLAFLALAYVGLAALAAARFRPLGLAFCAVACILPIGWALAPPNRFWVGYDELPRVPVVADPNTRFLLLPALPPLAALAGRASGVDPDLEPHADNTQPINQFEVTYPLSSALGRFLATGSVSGFEALSVAKIVDRPWLSTNPTVAWQFALPLPAWALNRRSAPATTVGALPELSLAPVPAVGTVLTNFGAGNVLFGDARAADGPAVPPAWHRFAPVRAIAAPRTFLRAADGWVDARLAFVEVPELGQSYGGALTTNARATLPVESRKDALVWVRGALYGNGTAPLVQSTNGYRWIPIPDGVDNVRCSGTCVVAAEADAPRDLPANPAVRPAVPVAFAAPLPWLAFATVNAGPNELLRYNVAYDRLWWGYAAGAPLAHVRIDGIANGFLIPARTRRVPIVIVEAGGLAITAAEAVATLGFFTLALAPVARRLRLRQVRVREARPTSAI